MNVKQDLIVRKVGERYFLNSQSNGSCVYIMNETTYRIFSLIKEGYNHQDIIDTLHNEFDVNRNELIQDVDMCINEMINASVIEE